MVGRVVPASRISLKDLISLFEKVASFAFTTTRTVFKVMGIQELKKEVPTSTKNDMENYKRKLRK
jgi:hypothetical protein